MKTSARTNHAGFSLLEIAIALGVVAFGLLTTVTLLPSGIETLRVSAADTAESRIVQEITARVQGSDWDQTNNLADFEGRTLYFDNQGNEMPEISLETIFTAQLGVGATGVALPGAEATESNDYLREVRINLTSLPAGITDRFTNPAKHRQIVMLATKMSQ